MKRKFALVLSTILFVAALSISYQTFFDKSPKSKPFRSRKRVSAQSKSAKKTNKPMVIEFVAEWCKFSQLTKPVVENLKQQYKKEVDFKIVDIDSANGRKMKRIYKVGATPTFIFVNDKEKRTTKVVGALASPQLELKIRELMAASGLINESEIEELRSSDTTTPSGDDLSTPVRACE